MSYIDLSGFSYFIPLLSFLVVFIIGYAVIEKAKLFEHKFWALFVSLIIAIIFVTASGPTRYVATIVPWFAVLVVSFVLLLAIMSFVKGDKGASVLNWGRGLTILFVVVALLLFVISAIFVFSAYIGPYLPWSSGYGGDTNVLHFTDWIYQPRVYGALLLLIVSGIVSWIVSRPVGK